MSAWQPLTPQGVAAFGRASLGRLLTVQFVFAVLAAATVVWFLNRNWFPIVDEAIRQLPAEGEIRAGHLDWRGETPMRLAEGRFLALTVDLDHEGQMRSPAHIQVEFGRADIRVFSLLGFVQMSYPAGVIGFNRDELVPWWGAWRPWILAMVVGGVMGGLMVVWWGLATAYCVPVWLVGLYGNRNLSLRGSWRVAGAALMPGALFMIAAVATYGLGAWDVIKVAVAMGLHFVIGWVYLVAGPLCGPVHPEATRPKGNPFAGRRAEGSEGDGSD